jgi:radical SAM enzyme (TIGR01210 family)
MSERRSKSVHRSEATSPVAVWKEREHLDGKTVDAGVIILRTSGCSHFHRGGCSMCGFNVESNCNVKSEDVIRQFVAGTQKLGQVDFLKVYTSGSFLDPSEIEKGAREAILKHCRDGGTRILFESRPEYVNDETLADVVSIHDDIEVALGLESSNDNVLRYSINKGFTFKDYANAAGTVHSHGGDVRTYVLLKPPFLSEAEAMADSIATMHEAAKMSETLSLNPVNVQKGTLVEKLWKEWSYRSPWLWSVLEVIKSCKDLSAKIICDPTGGGKERGAHNCGKCDDVIIDSLKSYSLTQDASRLGWPECGCSEIWRSVLELEDYVMGSCDLQRFFRKQRA